jgi:hypothetical protein
MVDVLYSIPVREFGGVHENARESPLVSPLAPAEVLILVGFLAILTFNLLAFVWLLKNVLSEQKTPFHMGALVLNIICLVLMAGEKVLVDEIAREYRLAGWEAAGEWVILYGCFGVQMLFILLMFFYLVRLPGRK